MKTTLTFRAKDAIAFVDAFRYGLRLSPEALKAEIEAQGRSNTLGPAGLKGLEAALSQQLTSAIPSVIRYEVDVLPLHGESKAG